VKRLQLEHAAVAAAAASAFAVVMFAVATDAMQPRHVVGSPILYVLLALGLFVALPLFALLHPWLGRSLGRYLLCGALLIAVAFGLLWLKNGGLPPLHPRLILWCVGHPVIAAITFWAVIRLLGTDDAETS
jgi:hypothetical protein